VKPYRVVVFDWDGTVMDSTHSIVASIQGACADLELPVPAASEARWVIGLSLESALRRAVPQLTAAQYPLFLQRYRAHFLRLDPDLALFEGIAQLFGELRGRGVQLAVATGKSRAGLDRALAKLGLREAFAATRCADESYGKPHPGMLLELMHELGAQPEHMVMVGDTAHDIEMAHAAQVDGVAVEYGAHDRETLFLSRPLAQLSSVADLRAWLLQRV
jgi:phosphoglycolate phosphatase